MTRASQISTAPCVRMSQPRWSGTGSGHPQWMRTLEEKYQKLHKKIIENTTCNGVRFNSCVGRPLYDSRFGVMTKQKDPMNLSARPFIRAKSSKVLALKTAANNQTDDVGRIGLNNGECSKENWKNQYLNTSKADTVFIDNVGLESENCDHRVEFSRPPLQDRISVYEILSNADSNSEKSGISKIEPILDFCDNVSIKEMVNKNAHDEHCERGRRNRDRDREREHGIEGRMDNYKREKSNLLKGVLVTNLRRASLEEDGENINVETLGLPECNRAVDCTCDKSDCDRLDTDRLEADKVVDVDKHARRNIKTSVSRTSKVTSKSLPIKLHQHRGNKSSHRQLLVSRSKSANRSSKMFTPMSAEAKHAITETIHEMNISTSGSKVTLKTDVFIPSRGRTCVKSWVLPKKAKSAQYDARKVLESSSKCLQDFQTTQAAERKASGSITRVDEPVTNRDDESCQSSAGSTHPDSRLPDILCGSARERSGVRNQKYTRLPGIGKYHIAKDDDVFEITPPGFDSRYKDLTFVETRESETPPPDIRKRAIDKCSEWLVKYNK